MLNIVCDKCKTSLTILGDNERFVSFDNASRAVAMLSIANFELLNGWLIEIGNQTKILCWNCRTD